MGNGTKPLSADEILGIFSAHEGEKHISEVIWRSRNRQLIEKKKSSSDYHCEVCGMKFEEVYGSIGTEYIVAHHLDPIGKRESVSPTTLDGIALVCANCHAMLHQQSPPCTIQKMRDRLTMNN
jgi:5-methylcytosine-specific restriction protein A